MRRPLDTPLLFVRAPITAKELVVFAGFDKRLKCRLSDVMDERVGGADYAIAIGTHALRVIIVLEHPNPEPFIEWSNSVVGLPPHGHAEHREHVNVGHLSVVA